MSKLLDSVLDPERRAEVAAADTRAVALDCLACGGRGCYLCCPPLDAKQERTAEIRYRHHRDDLADRAEARRNQPE